MVHMPNLESWEWGLKIFDGAPTLITHVHKQSHVYTSIVRYKLQKEKENEEERKNTARYKQNKSIPAPVA